MFPTIPNWSEHKSMQLNHFALEAKDDSNDNKKFPCSMFHVAKPCISSATNKNQ